jgi:tetratricopeptide (TPR) repeat protein
MIATTVPDQAVDRTRWFEALRSALADRATPKLVLVLEDVHWADAATLDWLTWVRGRPGAILVVATARSGTRIAGAQDLTIGPLGRDEIERIVGCPPELAAEVHDRSGGNPLLALAIASADHTDDVPSSVHDAVARSAAHLDQGLVEVARAIAVLDAADDIDLLSAVLQLPVNRVIDALERLVDTGFLVESGTGFAFRHALVRDALSRGTSAARTAFVHREAARVLAARGEPDPLAVALHARLGGVLDLAAESFARAAAVAADRADLGVAESHLRAAIEAQPTAGAHVALARVLMAVQRLDEAAADAQRAIELDGGPASFEIAGWVEYYRRRYDRALRFAEEAVDRASPNSPLHASALALSGRVRHSRGDAAGAEARLVASQHGPPAVRALGEVWLAQLRTHQGRPDEALDLVEHALLDPQRIAHPFAPLHGRFTRVMALGQRGQLRAAIEACDELRTAAARAGTVGDRFATVELNVRSWLLRAADRLSEASDLNRQAIERNGSPDGSGPRSDGFAEAYWVALLDLADGQMRAGDHDAASATVDVVAAIDTWDGTMAWHQRHRLGLLRSRLARERHDLDRAAQLAEAVRRDALARGAERYAALAAAELALAGADGDLDRIEQVVATLRRCAALELPPLLGQLGRRHDRADWVEEAAARAEALTAGLA